MQSTMVTMIKPGNTVSHQSSGFAWPDDTSFPSDGVDALIAGVQQRFPDFRFQLIGQPNGYGDHIRFSWGLGPDGADSPIKGTDFAVVRDGRIRSITGFLDQVPQSA